MSDDKITDFESARRQRIAEAARNTPPPTPPGIKIISMDQMPEELLRALGLARPEPLVLPGNIKHPYFDGRVYHALLIDGSKISALSVPRLYDVARRIETGEFKHLQARTLSDPNR